MISIELARELKEAGLVWEPKDGDFFATSDDSKMANIFVISGEHNLVPELGGKKWFFNGHLCNRDGSCRLNETASDCMNMDGVKQEGLNVYSVASARKMLWLPRLDQLLANIEGRGWDWDMGRIAGDGNGYYIGVSKDDYEKMRSNYAVAENPEEATGKALLWFC